MVFANYVSAWVGGLLFIRPLTNALPYDLYSAWRWVWLMVAAAFVLTLVIEWPFVLLSFRGRPDALRRSLRANLLVQAASYLCLIGWYWLASGTSLYTGMNIVPASDVPLPAEVTLFYISLPDGRLREHSLGEGASRPVDASVSKHHNDRLLIRTGPGESRAGQLVLRRETKDHDRPDLVVVKGGLDGQLASANGVLPTEADKTRGSWFNFGRAEILGEAVQSPWEVWTGFWPFEGLTATNGKTGHRAHFAFETPFAAWPVRNAIHLPNDVVLFQLGEDQICVMDLTTRKVALLTRGRGPAAYIPHVKMPAQINGLAK
jgi:hypothetical protein